MSYRIQHLKLGGILDQSIAIVRDHFGLLFTIMLVLWVPFTFLIEFAEVMMLPEMPAEPTYEDVERFSEAQSSLGIIYIISGLGSIILLPLTNAAVIHAVARTYLGERVTALQAIKYGLARYLPLLWTSILMGLAIIGGYMLLIIPGILFSLWFALAQHVVVIEKISGAKALGRSKELMRTHLGTFIILGLIMIFITLAAEGVSQLIPQKTIAVFAYTFATAITTMLWTAAGVVFYFSCRCAHDNFDLEYLAQSIGAEPSAIEDGETATGQAAY